MMDLYDHIRGSKDDGTECAKLAVHQFTAAAAELLRDKITKPQAAAMFPFLATTALTQANTLLRAVKDGTLTFERLEQVCELAEFGAPLYSTRAEFNAWLGL